MKRNKLKRYIDKLTIEKVKKFLKVIIVCMIFMVISEGLFEIPAVANFFGRDLLTGKSGWIVYVIIWLVLFAQVCIFPIPALPILVACNQIQGLVGSNFGISGLFSQQTLIFLLIGVSATWLGSLVSYWIGRIAARPIVIWIAGDKKEYNKWCKKLNTRKGKWLYAATVFLPIFPDDLLSLVCGSIKLDFHFYSLVNLVCKAIGLFSMLFVMRVPGLNIFLGKEDVGIPLALIAYTIILITALILNYGLDIEIKKNQPKKIKMEVVKEDILKYLNKTKRNYKELIMDYKLEKRLKTYLTSKIKIHKYYTVNKMDNKQKVRVFIECEISNYKQVIFDREYEMTEKYETLIGDFKEYEI